MCFAIINGVCISFLEAELFWWAMTLINLGIVISIFGVAWLLGKGFKIGFKK